MAQAKINDAQRGLARDTAGNATKIDTVAGLLIDLIHDRFDSRTYPELKISKQKSGVLEFEVHHRRIFTQLEHVILERNGIERDLGGRICFRLVVDSSNDKVASEEIFALTFDEHGKVSITKYPSIDFSINEGAPHIGYASKLVIDSILHFVQARLPVIAV